MQRSAEYQVGICSRLKVKGIMKTDEEFDDVVPLKILVDFARSFISGFGALMKELGFENELKVEWTGH